MSKHETVTITKERYQELLRKEAELGTIRRTLREVRAQEEIPDVEI